MNNFLVGLKPQYGIPPLGTPNTVAEDQQDSRIDIDTIMTLTLLASNANGYMRDPTHTDAGAGGLIRRYD